MKITEFYRPIDVQDAYEKLMGQKKATLMAGGMFLRLQNRTLPLVIDMEGLKLAGVKVGRKHGQSEGETLLIGAMTTLRAIELDSQLPEVLRASVLQIAGVGVRNLATIGGSVMGRYPFSDINTALAALGAVLHFHVAGEMPMTDFIENGLKERDMLLWIEVPACDGVKGCFSAYKKVYTDFALLNMAIVRQMQNLAQGEASSGNTGEAPAGNQGLKAPVNRLTISIGARPGAAQTFDVAYDGQSAEDLLAHVTFGDDYRSSAAYRQALAKAMLADALEEVAKWK